MSWDRRSVENVRLKQSQKSVARSISFRAFIACIDTEKSMFARIDAAFGICFVQMENGRSLPRHRSMPLFIGILLGAVHGQERCDGCRSLRQSAVAAAADGGFRAQLEHRIRLGDIYRNRVIALVSPIVGAGNVTAQVNLDMDFTRSEVTEEVVDPEGNALRSEQRSSDFSNEVTARGVPGATTNRAPTQTDIETQQGDDAANGAMKNRSTSETRNYEVSRTVSTTLRPSNQIVRIQAAVLVRDMEVINPETGIAEVQEIPQEKLDEITALVSNAIGIDDDRGDSLTVSSSTFVSALEGVKKPWYDMDWAINIMRQGLTIIIMAVVVLGVIRPLINRIMVPAAGGTGRGRGDHGG